MRLNHTVLKIIFLLLSMIFIHSCGLYKKTDTRNTPINSLERAQKNIEEGRGASISNLLNRKNTFEFSTSNPMWRATLEVLDFLPLANVDYSGGIITTDWYNNDINSNTSLKVTIRFLSNEISSSSLKIIVHQKICDDKSCKISTFNSKIPEELKVSILKKASQLEKTAKK